MVRIADEPPPPYTRFGAEQPEPEVTETKLCGKFKITVLCYYVGATEMGLLVCALVFLLVYAFGHEPFRLSYLCLSPVILFSAITLYALLYGLKEKRSLYLVPNLCCKTVQLIILWASGASAMANLPCGFQNRIIGIFSGVILAQAFFVFSFWITLQCFWFFRKLERGVGGENRSPSPIFSVF